ncbi:mitogen-activated protein kinase kinase kinase 4-like [Styela clava]
MNYDVNDLLEATPPRRRSRSKIKNAKSGGAAANGSDAWKVDPKNKHLMFSSKDHRYINSPRSSMRKKKTEIRSHQRDAKRGDSIPTARDGDDIFGDNDIVIGRRASVQSDMFMLGSGRPLRCLSTSCVSERDFVSDNIKSNSKSKGKGRKNQSKIKFQKPSPTEQMRHRYMQRLRQVVTAGNNKQNQSETDRSKVDHKTSQMYRLRRNELIWLELQAWFNDHSLMEQDQILFNARHCLVMDVLSFVSVFQFDSNYITYLKELKEKIDSTLEQIPEAACEECDSYMSSNVSDLEVSQQSDKDISDIESPKALPHANRFFHDTSLEYDLETNILFPTKKYIQLQEDALSKVGEVLKLLCIIENLYPSSSTLSAEYPYYSSEEFQSKIESLCCWYNTTSDLKGKLNIALHLFHFNLTGLSENEEETSSTSNEIPSYLSVDTFKSIISEYTSRILKRKAVKSILHTFIHKHFSGLFRAKMNLLPKQCYISTPQMSRIENESDFMDHNGDSDSVQFLIGCEEEREVSFANVWTHLNCVSQSTRKDQTSKLSNLLTKINNVFSESHGNIFEGNQLDFVIVEASAVSPSDCNTALFNLPSIKPLYLFFPRVLFAIMKQCMHLRMKQAMPFFNNSGSSVCLLTAKQLVAESKEMLECGLLARDILNFLIGDIYIDKQDEDNTLSMADYEADLRCMLTTYLDFVNAWLVKMLGDLPHAPRGFQEILEQEWVFANNISPLIDFDGIVMCASRFIRISADIVDSTREFIVSAINALIESQTDMETPSPAEQNPYKDLKKERRISDSIKHTSKAQAGVLWFHRQRSESPHLSRHNSVQSSESVTPVSSPTEFNMNRQISTTSSSSSANSLPWLSYKQISQNGYQKRYLFELCRAVRDLFIETRERATRILSFGKRLRKALEPAIGFDVIYLGNSPEMYCSYCQLLESMSSEGYVLVDISDTLLKMNWRENNSNENGLSTPADYVDLQNYWIFIPDPKDQLEMLKASLECAGVPESITVWGLVERALFNHLLTSSGQKHGSDREVENSTKMDCVIFVKKPSENAGLRRQSEVTFPMKKKARGKGKMQQNRFERMTQKTRSESNLRTQIEMNGGETCMNRCTQGQGCTVWNGDVIKIHFQDNTYHSKKCQTSLALLSKSFRLSHDITVVLASADDVGIMRKEMSLLFTPFAKLNVAQMPIVKEIKESFDLLRSRVLELSAILRKSMQKTLSCLESHSDKILQQRISRVGSFDMDSRQQVMSEVNEVMQSCFNFGFDFIKEATRIMSGEFRSAIDKMHMELAVQWMDYVMKHREKGKGHRPRWASQGLTFVVNMDSAFVVSLGENEFSSLKQKIDSFISHLIGEKEKGDTNTVNKNSVPSRETKSLSTLHVPKSEPQVLRSLSNSSTADPMTRAAITYEEELGALSLEEDDDVLAPSDRIRYAVEELEMDKDRRRIEAGIIGQVSDNHRPTSFVSLGVRTVNFRWQRGARVGEGSFGRVYTCVNVDTGTILAMKEVKFQPNDLQKIRSALDEYTNFEGIKHPNLVQYYGVELHRDEMYLFMEYCDGGTLADICKICLPELMVRRYTSQVLAAVHTLHSRGIVHRDIKGSNIFLTTAGVVKLGDFGSALKLKDTLKTMPGEMITHIGTTMAYTAPEVINSSEKVGYGRASDIWSLGCVVIEMASGKQPWHDMERFQVMFRVGSGESPAIPDMLTVEGKDFVKKCTVPDPTKRLSAEQLLGHQFVRAVDNDDMS